MKEVKTYTLAEMKDKYIGKVGAKDRDQYEYELRMEVLGKMIKTARQERNLTQEELGKLAGVQKTLKAEINLCHDYFSSSSQNRL